MLPSKLRSFAIIASSLGLVSCSTVPPRQSASPESPVLKEAFEGKFLIGATLGAAMLDDPSHPDYAIVRDHFNSVTIENDMKWGIMNPSPGAYELQRADRFVAYGQEKGLALVGHTLFWHSQTPDWVFEDENSQPLSREALLRRMRERARLMAERYGDQIAYWDVVNESIMGDGSWRPSKFVQIIGEDFTEQAFRIAMEELPPQAKLLYNDYSMTEEGRRHAVIKMVADFRAKGIRIDGIGIQGHWTMEHPQLKEIDTVLRELSTTGLPLHITELDLDFLGRDGLFDANVDLEKQRADPARNRYPEGQLPALEEQRFTQRYAQIFRALLKHADSIERVTFWGVTDANSWLNDWPLEGRTNYALLFDRQGHPKPALEAIIAMASATPPPPQAPTTEGR